MSVSQKQIDFIKSYFKTLKIRTAKDNKQFWSILYDRYEKNVVDKLLEIVAERPEKSISDSYMPELYNIKNQNLELSLDFSRMTCDLHTQYLQWFIGALKTKPGRILDIGCDNGIVTCFYAMFFPETEVVGIDPCQYGINCAAELAAKLKLSNIIFKKAGIDEACELYPAGHFDIITSVTTAKEIIGSLVCEILAHPDKYSFWYLEDLPVNIGSEDVNKSLASIEKLLSANGKYISFERWFVEDCIWWSEKLKNIGLYIDWDESQTLRFQEVGQNRTFPALIADKTVRQYDSFHCTVDCWLKDEVMDPLKKHQYDGLSAEMMFKRFVNKEFIGGVQCNYIKSSLKIRFEVWKADEVMLCYQNSNSGYRELKIIPVQSNDSAKEMLLNLKQYHSQNGYKTFYYKDYHDINNFN